MIIPVEIQRKKKQVDRTSFTEKFEYEFDPEICIERGQVEKKTKKELEDDDMARAETETQKSFGHTIHYICIMCGLRDY